MDDGPPISPPFPVPFSEWVTSAETYWSTLAKRSSRLLAFDGERVTFRWKDYAHGDKQRKMTLSATEFLRRFAQHILPRGFVRIRQYGFLATRHRTAHLAIVR